MFKLVEVEADHEEAQKEMSSVRRHLADMEDDHRLKERNFLVTLEEAEQTEYQLSDERRRLVQSLDEAGTELIEMRLRLSAAESHISALESQLSQVDGRRLETETKLSSVVSSLRRFVGLGTDCGDGGAGGGGTVLRSRSLSSPRPRSRSSTTTQLPDTGELHSCLTPVSFV